MKARRMPALLVLVLAVLVSACATESAWVANENNPPPSENFSDFQHFELQPLSLSSGVEDDSAGGMIQAKLQARLANTLGELLGAWNQQSKAADGRTLSVQPQIERMNFVKDIARTFAGSWAGSSAVLLRVRYVDAATGESVASPVFVQHAWPDNGKRGVGTNNDFMLQGLATLATQYTRMNYRQAQGGPTGRQTRQPVQENLR